MYDFNYFRPYHKAKGKTNWSRLLGLVLVLAVLVLVALNVVKMVTTLSAFKGEIASLEARLKDPQLMEIAREVEEAQGRLTGLRSDSFTAGAMREVVDHETVFGYGKLETVIDRLVDSCHLESIQYAGRRLSLRGVVDHKALANLAQLAYNLRASEEFGDFNVNMLSRPSSGDGQQYDFEIEFVPAEYAAGFGR